MKKDSEDYTILCMIIMFLLATICSCSTKTERQVKPREIYQQYQVQIDNDSIYLLDGSKLITVMPLDSSTQIGNAIILDNQ